MKYDCGWGCTSYNPNCDACDSYNTDDNILSSTEREDSRFAISGEEEYEDDSFSIS